MKKKTYTCCNYNIVNLHNLLQSKQTDCGNVWTESTDKQQDMAILRDTAIACATHSFLTTLVVLIFPFQDVSPLCPRHR